MNKKSKVLTLRQGKLLSNKIDELRFQKELIMAEISKKDEQIAFLSEEIHKMSLLISEEEGRRKREVESARSEVEELKTIVEGRDIFIAHLTRELSMYLHEMLGIKTTQKRIVLK